MSAQNAGQPPNPTGDQRDLRRLDQWLQQLRDALTEKAWKDKPTPERLGIILTVFVSACGAIWYLTAWAWSAQPNVASAPPEFNFTLGLLNPVLSLVGVALSYLLWRRRPGWLTEPAPRRLVAVNIVLAIVVLGLEPPNGTGLRAIITLLWLTALGLWVGIAAIASHERDEEINNLLRRVLDLVAYPIERDKERLETHTSTQEINRRLAEYTGRAAEDARRHVEATAEIARQVRQLQRVLVDNLGISPGALRTEGRDEDQG